MIVLRPLIKAQEEQHLQQAHRKAFTALSQEEKLAALIRKGQTLMYSRGFSKGPEPIYRPMQTYPHYASLAKRHGNTYSLIHLLAIPGVNKTQLKHVPRLWHFPLMTREENSRTKRLVSNFVVIALRSSRTETLSNLLPHMTPIADRAYTTQVERWGDEKPEHTANVFFADGMQSVEELVERFKPILQAMNES